jgi:hypothetical protein
MTHTWASCLALLDLVDRYWQRATRKGTANRPEKTGQKRPKTLENSKKPFKGGRPAPFEPAVNSKLSETEHSRRSTVPFPRFGGHCGFRNFHPPSPAKTTKNAISSKTAIFYISKYAVVGARRGLGSEISGKWDFLLRSLFFGMRVP